jgi:site-specific recombinase XerD
MNAPTPNTLARALRMFFADHLPRVRGVSPHTVQSYRDSIVLLLRFVAARRKHPVTTLDIEDLGPADVLDFLQHLEADRHNSAGTRNVRLSAIHAFVRYCATIHPERLELCQRVLAVPFKRHRSRAVEYLDYDEIKTVLASANRATPDGRRDYALLATMFNTGARVQEVVGIRWCDLQLKMQPHVRLFGKGRKERVCPLWRQTADVLSGLLADCKGECVRHAILITCSSAS